MRVQPRYSFYLATFLAIAFLIVSPAQSTAAANSPDYSVTIAGGAASTMAIGHWKIQSSAKAQQSGQTISKPNFSTKKWYPVSAHATVLAGLLENGKYAHIFHGDNLRAVARHHFAIPWWYRTEFRLGNGGSARHTLLKINGIIPCADIWLNGNKIADHTEIAGAFTVHELDVTKQVQAGVNTLAVKVYPANPERDLSPGWIDWNPAAPDNDMGIWRDIEIVRTGPVSLRGAHVLSKLHLPKLDRAELTVKVTVRNNENAARNAVVAGKAAGVSLRRRLHLGPHQTRTVSFTPATNPGLRLKHPRVWWPVGLGKQPLYHVSLTAQVDGALSDRAQATFGIRSVTSHLNKQGHRQFAINGKPLLIRGAGWAPDMFLRDRPQRLAEEFHYVRNLGLNAIRTEGKLERPDFYRLADREGILILPGWECCDKWEAWAGTGGEPWDAADRKIAAESMASEARRLRNHPSVIAFLIGSDNAPPPPIATIYANALHAADWPDPIVSAVSAQKTEPTGPSGFKMSGPYAWVPPNYWYADKRGGAFGFNSETSAGIDIPRLASLKTMLTPQALKALWQHPDIKQFHAAPAWSPFSSLKRFDTALAHRYGAPKSLADYVEKAQLANYEAVRAQFEAYSAHMDAANPSTGVIYWMLNNAWPSLHWHLFNHDLNPAGAYFGAKKANEPVHIQYSYDNRSVVAVNHTRRSLHDLNARIRLYNLDGRVRYDKRLSGIDLSANHTRRLIAVPKPANLSRTYFIELTLMNAHGHRLSRNVYWLSRRPDRLDWAHSKWYVTPVSRYADLTGLEHLPKASVHAHASTRHDGKRDITTVTLTTSSKSKAVALFEHLSIRQNGDGKPVLPVTWSGNDVTLWPGESVTLTAHYQAADGVKPVVQLSGWNIDTQTIE
jgi:exo-1,4-beta-D-glucosaminidase